MADKKKAEPKKFSLEALIERILPKSEGKGLISGSYNLVQTMLQYVGKGTDKAVYGIKSTYDAGLKFARERPELTVAFLCVAPLPILYYMPYIPIIGLNSPITVPCF